MRKRISKELRIKIYNKFGGLCAYTGTALKDDWQVDHITPVINGGLTEYNNLIPCQKIVNHYKRACDLETFRTWLLGELHLRLRKLPINPKVEKSINHKRYLLEVAGLFNITRNNPFNQIFYFETLTPHN